MTKHHIYTITSRSNAFLEKYNNEKNDKDFIEMGLDEIRMYEKYKKYYSYVFYIARKKNS